VLALCFLSLLVCGALCDTGFRAHQVLVNSNDATNKGDKRSLDGAGSQHGAPRPRNVYTPRAGDDLQCFPWADTYSIAREDFEYIEPSTMARLNATAGELIKLKCDGVVCPNPKVDDCYMNEDMCAPHGWCMLQDQQRLGPWAMADGETPNMPVGGPAELDCKYYREHGLTFLYEQICQGKDNWGPWKAVRGRCVPFRREQQSCNAYMGTSTDGATDPLGMVHYVAGLHDARPPRRPMVCGPGLVCTGEVDPVQYTCVKARPPNVCYVTSWWDSSSWCKDGGAPINRQGGLPRVILEEVVRALLIQLPVEKYGSPLSHNFWFDPSADKARLLIQNIVRALWPEQYRSKTIFPIAIPDPRKAVRAGGAPDTAAWNTTAHEAALLYKQANKLWSAIHTLIHNVRDPMSSAAVHASRSLALWLRQHFGCQNCRGFWATDVLNVVGLPPETSEREKHKRWWWNVHNMVSEHTAATRGGHPWVWLAADSDEEFAQLGAKYKTNLIRCQNPWFLPYDVALTMWDIVDTVPLREHVEVASSE